VTIGPAVVLAVVVGVFHVSAYVFIRGRAGARVPLLLVAAVLGSWAGDAVGGRLGDPVRIGDFHVLAASAVAWLGILLVAILAVLVPERARDVTARPSIGRRVLAGLGRSEAPVERAEPVPQPGPEARP
jgi:hypothetical protein